MGRSPSLSPQTDDREVRRMEDDETFNNSRIWTKTEEAILKDSLKGYRAAEYGDKGNYILEHVVNRIKALDAKKYGTAALKEGGDRYDEWKAKKKRIFAYMSSHGSIPHGVKLPGLNKKFTFTAVVRELRKDDILAEAKKMAEENDSDDPKYNPAKAWLKYYQQARIKIENSLLEDEREVIIEQMDIWNKGNVPPAVQQKMAKTHSQKILNEMARRNFVTMGMRSVILECHMDVDGTMVYSLTDTESLKLDDPRIPAFRDYDPKGVKDMEDAYKRYIKHVWRILLNEVPPAAAEPTQKIELTYYPGGLPRVPELVDNLNGTETNRIQQKIIRTFLNKHYQLASGKKGAAPYATIQEDPARYFTAEFWPPGVQFREPSKYASSEGNAILNHWRTRQAQNKVSFKFERVPIGKSVEPENYPTEIFTLASTVSPPAAAVPPARTKSTQRQYKDTIITETSDEEDSENYNSQQDDEQEDEEDLPDSEGSDVGFRPPTPPDSQVETSSVGGTREPSECPTEILHNKQSQTLKRRKQNAKAAGKNKGKAKESGTPAAAAVRLTRAQAADNLPPKDRTRSKTAKKTQ